MEKLKVDHVQTLEALVIDAIYRNVIRGQLDQKTQILQVDVAMGRDVSDTESQHLKRRLEQWYLLFYSLNPTWGIDCLSVCLSVCLVGWLVGWG